MLTPTRTLLLAAAALAAALCPTPARAAKVTVPVDVGVGPAAYTITGPVADDQPWHFGLKISVQAIIDRELIQQNQKRIPKKYRKMASGIEEMRVSPSVLIPDALFISPKFRNTGMYGITWRPLSLSVPLLRGAVGFRLQLGLLLTYAYLYSDALPTTHFFRPGLDGGAELEFALSKSFLISLGWASGVYIPQKVGSWAHATPFDQTMWHFGQAFLKFHVRFPFTTAL